MLASPLASSIDNTDEVISVSHNTGYSLSFSSSLYPCLQGMLAYSWSGKWMEARDLALQWRERASSPNPPHPLRPLRPQPRSSEGATTSSWRYFSADSSSFVTNDDGSNSNEGDDDLLSPSRRLFPPPPAECNTALIKAMGKAGKTDEVLAWLRDTTKSAAAAAATGAWGSQTTASETAVSGEASVSSRPEPPLDHSSFLAALSACSRVGEWHTALEVLREMDAAGIMAETSAYNMALAGACFTSCFAVPRCCLLPLLLFVRVESVLQELVVYRYCP